MRLNLKAVCGALGLTAALVVCGPVLAGGAHNDDSADFRRMDPSRADMTLIREKGQWRVLIRAGGLPNGAATAADCELQARGAQDLDDAIHARIIPFKGELNDLTAADIGADAPVIVVRVGPEGAFVEDRAAAARFCGMGSDISGFYTRSQTPD